METVNLFEISAMRCEVFESPSRIPEIYNRPALKGGAIYDLYRVHVKDCQAATRRAGKSLVHVTWLLSK